MAYCVANISRAKYKYKPEWESEGSNIRRRSIQPNLNKPEAQGHSCKTKLIAKFGPLLQWVSMCMGKIIPLHVCALLIFVWYSS